MQTHHRRESLPVHLFMDQKRYGTYLGLDREGSKRDAVVFDLVKDLFVTSINSVVVVVFDPINC